MALIKCVDCGNEISDKAERCPVCGRVYHKASEYRRQALRNSNIGMLIALFFFVSISLVICGVLILNNKTSAQSSSYNYENNYDYKTVPKTEKERAVDKARSYLKVTALSYEGMIDQLKYEGFSESDAKYGADNCGASWREQAKKKAASYLTITDLSRTELIKQLEFEGFTIEQAIYGADENGL